MGEVYKKTEDELKKNSNRTVSERNIPKMTTYFYGKVAEVVYVLATHPGDIKRRLIVAGEKMLLIPPNEVPEDVREDVKWIHQQLTRFAPIYGGTLLDGMRVTLNSIRRSTCEKIAKRIMHVYSRLEDYVEKDFPSSIG